MYIQGDQDLHYYSLQQLNGISRQGSSVVANHQQLRNSSDSFSHHRVHAHSLSHGSTSHHNRPRKNRFKNFLFGSGSAGSGYGSYSDLNSNRMTSDRYPGSPGGRPKRPLKCPILQAPDYTLDSHVFIDSYIEVESQYLGILKDIQRNFPLNSRQTVLTTIDKAKQLGQLPYTYQPCDDVIISMSIHNIKIMRRDNEVLILRVFLHEIEAVAMVSDCAVTYVLLKVIPTANAAKRSSDCRILVLKFVSSALAEETCALFKQLFATLFNESAIHALTPPLKDAASFSNGSAQGTPIDNSPGFNITAPGSSRNSSIALETSIGSGHEVRFSRPTSMLISEFPKSTSMFYDSPPQYANYSPVVRNGQIASPHSRNNVFSHQSSPFMQVQQQSQFNHQRAFSESNHHHRGSNQQLNSPGKISASRLQESSPFMGRNYSSVSTNQKFLKEVQKALTNEEVKQFNAIVHSYLHEGRSVNEFIEGLGSLLGPERLHLMNHLGRFLSTLQDSNQLDVLLREHAGRVREQRNVSPGGEGDVEIGARSENGSSLSSQSLILADQNSNNYHNGRSISNDGPDTPLSSRRATTTAADDNNPTTTNNNIISKHSNSSSSGGGGGKTKGAEARKNVMSYCSSSSSSCSFSATAEGYGSSTAERNRDKNRNSANGPKGKYFPNSETSEDKPRISLSGKNGRVKVEKRNREFTGSDERSGSSSNNNSRLDSSTNLEDIPQELLELDSMLAQMGMVSPSGTIGTQHRQGISDDPIAENENKTLEAPTNTSSSNNSNSSYAANSSTYKKLSSGESKRRKENENAETSNAESSSNGRVNNASSERSTPQHLKQMFDPPGNDL